MAIKTTTTKTRATIQTSGVSVIFRSTVIAALIANLFLSADALRCHQCNSHLDEDCFALRLSTPRAPRDNQYLKECEDHSGNATVFCRKTTVTIEVTGEHRVLRGCGWIPDGSQFSCFSADNEGYLQTICSCSEDGCNAAPHRTPSRWLLGVGGVSLLLVSWLCRSSAAAQ